MGGVEQSIPPGSTNFLGNGGREGGRLQSEVCYWAGKTLGDWIWWRGSRVRIWKLAHLLLRLLWPTGSPGMLVLLKAKGWGGEEAGGRCHGPLRSWGQRRKGSQSRWPATELRGGCGIGFGAEKGEWGSEDSLPASLASRFSGVPAILRIIPDGQVISIAQPSGCPF